MRRDSVVRADDRADALSRYLEPRVYQRNRALDTTMGLTPLEGLAMGTRSGDVDPSLLLFLQQREGLSLRK
jgi:hypothetical protein